jgi:hypothetical protein
MDRTKLESRIIRDLARHRSKNDIVKEVCEAAGMRWDAAERLVNDVQRNHSDELFARQKSILYLLGIATALGGLVLSAGVLAATLDGWMFLFLRLPIPYLGNAFYILLGLLITIGGLAGISRLRKHPIGDDGGMQQSPTNKRG